MGNKGFLAFSQPQVDRLADFTQVIAWPCIIFSQSYSSWITEALNFKLSVHVSEYTLCLCETLCTFLWHQIYMYLYKTVCSAVCFLSQPWLCYRINKTYLLVINQSFKFKVPRAIWPFWLKVSEPYLAAQSRSELRVSCRPSTETGAGR